MKRFSPFTMNKIYIFFVTPLSLSLSPLQKKLPQAPLLQQNKGVTKNDGKNTLDKNLLQDCRCIQTSELKKTLKIR
jgi:hypothetical protein